MARYQQSFGEVASLLRRPALVYRGQVSRIREIAAATAQVNPDRMNHAQRDARAGHATRMRI